MPLLGGITGSGFYAALALDMALHRRIAWFGVFFALCVGFMLVAAAGLYEILVGREQ